MTFNEMTHQVFDLSVGGHINGEKYTLPEFRAAVGKWLAFPDDIYVAEICLPDGRWYFKMVRNDNYYDYTIPDTREQEQEILDELHDKVFAILDSWMEAFDKKFPKRH